MFFDKSSRFEQSYPQSQPNCSVGSNLSPPPLDQQGSNSTKSSEGFQPTKTKSRMNKTDYTSLLGPGCYHNESTMVKPSFNRLAGASEPPTKSPSSIKQTTPNFVRRSSLQERRQLGADLHKLLSSSDALEKAIFDFEADLINQLEEQADMQEI